MPLNISTGVIKRPPRMVLHGPSGSGKSTLADTIPGALVFDLEGGSDQIECARVDVTHADWPALLAAVEEVTSDHSGFSTLVVDTVTVAQAKAEDYVCKRAKKSSIADFGYGKGDVLLLTEMQKLLDMLNRLRDSGMAVVLISQTDVKRFDQPDELGGYDRYALRLSKKVAPEVLAWADVVAFLNFKSTIVQDENGKSHAVNEQRVLNFEHTPAFDAKNRYGLGNGLPAELGTLAPIFNS